MVNFKLLSQLFVGTAVAVAMAGCGSSENGAGDGTDPQPTPTSSSGQVNVSYAFVGVEAPSKVRLVLINAATTGETCSTLPYNPTTGIVIDRLNLPINGSLNFTPVTPGSKYIVLALGDKTDGTRVAKGCHDQVNVLAGQTTTVNLTLENWVGDLNGIYLVTDNVNLGLPVQIQSALLALQAVCGLIDQPTICNIVSEVTDVVSSMDVVSQWTIDRQADGSYKGTTRWISVQGVDVGTIDLVEGTFIGEVPGSTQMNFKDFNSTIQFGNLILFIIEDVLGHDLGVFGPAGASLITTLSNNYVSPLVYTGTGILGDLNHDGVEEKITGSFNGHVQVANWSHDYALTYTALRQ